MNNRINGLDPSLLKNALSREDLKQIVGGRGEQEVGEDCLVDADCKTECCYDVCRPRDTFGECVWTM